MNDAPVAVDDTVSTNENTALILTQADLKGNDTDIDNANADLSVTAVSNPTNGTVVLNGDGTITFIPATDFNGTAGFDYTLSDGSLTDIGHVAVNVTAVNDAPVAVDDTATKAEDTVLILTQADLKGNDTDVDNSNSQLSVTAVSNPTNGTVVLNGDGTITFTPAANFNGVAGFDYTLSDGSLTDTGHVTVNVGAVNNAPVAVDDSLTSIAEDSGDRTISFASLTANDTDVDNVNSELTITGVSNPVGGTVSIVGADLIFTPTPDFNGAASFDYTLSDGSLTDRGSVSFTITAVNDAPVAVDDSLTSIAEDSGDRTISFASLTANDTDVDNTNSELTITGVSNPVGGTVSIVGTEVIFTPSPNFNGAASFDYTLSDGSLTDTGSVSFTITAVNDAPVAVDDTATTAEDTVLILNQGDLTGNDTDVDNSNGQLSVTAVSNPTNGTVVLNGDGTITFTPAANFNGVAGFDYTLSDGSLTDIGRVTVNVTAVNDAPVAFNGTLNTNQGVAQTGTLVVTDVDTSPAQLTISVVSQPSHGTVQITNVNTGAYIYTPTAGYNGQDSFTFRANDGSFNSNIATVSINVASNVFVRPSALVIDNASASGYSETGSWKNKASQGSLGYLGNLRYANPNATAYSGNAWDNGQIVGRAGTTEFATADVDTATFTFSGLTAGTYQIAVVYKEGNNRATNASFTVSGTGASSQTVLVNQRLIPSSFISDAGKPNATSWHTLISSFGVISENGTITVVLTSAGANGYVIADAVRIQQIAPLHASVEPAADPVLISLTNREVERLAKVAIERWQDTGLSAADLSALKAVQFEIDDLPGSQLGAFASNVITIDSNAAGYGWFVDRTPRTDREFVRADLSSELIANGDSKAVGKFDLLTVLMHELGHSIGMGHDSNDGHLMGETIGLSTRRLLETEFELIRQVKPARGTEMSPLATSSSVVAASTQASTFPVGNTPRSSTTNVSSNVSPEGAALSDSNPFVEHRSQEQEERENLDQLFASEFGTQLKSRRKGITGAR